jgi:hypothetical protein
MADEPSESASTNRTDELRTDGGMTRRSVMRAAGAAAGGAALFPLSDSVAAQRTNADGPRTSFEEPVQMNEPPDYGYEPSVHVDRFGYIYSTAHKASVTNEGSQLSSYMWYSDDGGDTWQEMPSPAGIREESFAFEGDIAIDDNDGVYYCDTDLGDNFFYRWRATEDGPVFELEKVMGTARADDRPWIRAHGDGIVYYLGNNGVSTPDPTGKYDGRIDFYRSENGGNTFTTGKALETGEYVSLAESKANAEEVFFGAPVEMDDGLQFAVFTSDDNGRTIDREIVDSYETTSSDPFPAWSATDRAGNDYHVWADDDPFDDEPGILNFTRRRDGGFETLDITPFEGSFTKQWISGGSEGLVAVAFYATEDVPVVENSTDRSQASNWFPYVLVTTDARASSPGWTLVKLDDEPAATDGGEPEDFFEVEVGPEDRIHVTYGREVYDKGTADDPTTTYRNNLFYVQGEVSSDGGPPANRGPPDVTGNGQPPRDPDGDGRYEDVNGDGEADVVDAQALFTNRDDPAVQNNPGAFDFNRDDEFGIIDVQSLFEQVN